MGALGKIVIFEQEEKEKGKLSNIEKGATKRHLPKRFLNIKNIFFNKTVSLKIKQKKRRSSRKKNKNA